MDLIKELLGEIVLVAVLFYKEFLKKDSENLKKDNKEMKDILREIKFEIELLKQKL